MKGLLLFTLMSAALFSFSGNLYANHPDSLQFTRQYDKVKDCKTRYQGEVAYEFTQLFRDFASGVAGFTTTHGVSIRGKIFVGAGTGLFSLSVCGLMIPYYAVLVPVYTTVKGYYSIGKKTKLFTSLDIGTYIGPMIAYFYPRIGISFLHNRHRKLSISSGVHIANPFSDFKDSSGIGLRLSYSW